ncbi:MAG: sugar ABC transporter permease [Gemmatimonadetes bacterium]|nr:sugar ABC transporter permease [Gemmatimonadota bacterium]MBT7420915.1 sugar ABC transporter permease [Gemmatimonadota bacterium]
MNEQSRNTRYFFLFISPWLVGFSVFILGPIISSIYLSFTKYSISDPPRWVGLDNYAVIFKGWEPSFYNSVEVTIAYSVLAVPLGVSVALFAALMLNVPKIKGMSYYRTIFFLPSLLPAVATTITWAFVFNPKYGYLNAVYTALLGGDGPDWFMQHTLGCLIMIAVWGFGNTMMIFLAGLQEVPKSLVEAATVDGANAWQRFWHVTVPAIFPVLFFNIVVGIIGSFQVFTQAFVFRSIGGAQINEKAVFFYVLNIYENAFQYGRFGLACALAWILMVAILMMTLVQFYLKKRWAPDGE